MFGVQFYPTPANLVRMMVDCVDWSRVRMMLEPSAGKGDILDGVKAAGHHCAMECAEIDPDLREVLRGQWPAGCGAHSYTAIWDRRRQHANGDT